MIKNKGKEFKFNIDCISIKDLAYADTLNDLHEQLKMLVIMARMNKFSIHVIHIFQPEGKLPEARVLEDELTERYDYYGIYVHLKYSEDIKPGFYIYPEHESASLLINYTRKNAMNSFLDISYIQQI